MQSFILNKFQLQKFWASAEIKTGLFWGRKKNKRFNFDGSSKYIHRKLKQTLAPCWPHVARVCFSFLWTCWRLNKIETRHVGKLVQHHQDISNPLREKLKVGAIFKPSSQQTYQIDHKRNSSVIEMLKIAFSTTFEIKFALNQKNVFSFGHLDYFFCFSRLNVKHILMKDQNSNGTHIQSKS